MDTLKTAITSKTTGLQFARNWIFGLTIFVSAFLLFQVQPMIGKYILPWFGGGPSVWTAAMLFFQVLLLGGYAYAHYLSRRDLPGQGKIHLGLALVALVWIAAMALRWDTPITPDASWKPAAGEFPTWRVLAVLGVSVGLPYFLLSTTSSIVQAWFSRMHHQSSPYAFYVLSNTASLLALLSYPVLFEPNWSVKQQAIFWSLGFVLYLGLIGYCSLRARARPLAGSGADAPPAGEEPGEQAAGLDVPYQRSAPSRRTRFFWVSLAACASVMLLASTNQMSQDIAPIPFLWVLPLSLYLLSFVVAFNDHQQRFRGLYVALALVAMFLGLWNLAYGSRSSIWFQISSNALMLFVICLLCHSQLYLHRPHPRYLTSFYLMLSIGGALGGIFVSLIAPLIFRDFWEYNLGLIYCGVIVIVIAYRSRPKSLLYRLRIPVAVVSLVLAIFILVLPVMWVTRSVEMSRNFYGVVKVRRMGGSIPGFDLHHGAIVHGGQASIEPYRRLPIRYYTESSGIAQAFLNYPRRAAGEPVRIGVLGLGVGTLAAFGRAGDTIRFYEIDPDVIRFAEDTRYFTYLKDSPAKVEIIPGDGRLSIERELRESHPQEYDIFVIDAFSGDSIPMHLISAEAIELYLAHLREGGVLAFNITNGHINMEPVLALAAEHFGMPAVYLAQPDPKEELSAASTWVLFSSQAGLFDSPGFASIKRELRKTPGIRLWTDDYSNLFQVLR